jgi:hypothetical protein
MILTATNQLMVIEGHTSESREDHPKADPKE